MQLDLVEIELLSTLRMLQTGFCVGIKRYASPWDVSNANCVGKEGCTQALTFKG